MADPVGEALTALSGPGRRVSDNGLPEEPGLYALYGDEAAWIELSLGPPPPDRRPLYIGRTKRTLARRVGKEHFGTGRTPESTVRRTLAALLREKLSLHPVIQQADKPSGYGLRTTDEERLTDWMASRLLVAVHAVAGVETLRILEGAVVRICEPPLNQGGVDHQWKGMVGRAREAMADQAHRSADAGARLIDLPGRIEIEDVRRELR